MLKTKKKRKIWLISVYFSSSQFVFFPAYISLSSLTLEYAKFYAFSNVKNKIIAMARK